MDLKDIKVCLERLTFAKASINKHLTNGGNKNIYNCLALEGDKDIGLPPHPIMGYTEDERRVFFQLFGVPIEFPIVHGAMIVSFHDFLLMIDTQYKKLKEMMTK